MTADDFVRHSPRILARVPSSAVVGVPVGEELVGPAALVSGDPFCIGKRRWDDDVVFRNQANEPKVQRRFINDTVRSDFHKRFLNRYIR